MLIPFWKRWSVEERCYVFDIESAWTYKFQELFTRNSLHCSHFFIFLEKKEKDDFHWNPHSVNRADCSLNVDSFQMKRTNFMWIGWMFRFHEKKNRRRQKRKCLRVGRKNSGTACIQTIWMSTYPNPIYVIKNANRKRFTWKIPSEMLVDMQKMVATVVETEMLKGVWFKDRS